MRLANVRPYQRAPEFTEVTGPRALLEAHKTKQSVWALIHVLERRLAYWIGDRRRPRSGTVLTAQTSPGAAEPTIRHDVKPLGAVRFYVEFHRREETS